MEIYNENQYFYISPSAATYQVYSGKCLLKRIVVNTTAAAAIGIIDSISSGTVNVGELKASTAEGAYDYEVNMANGIRLNVAGSSDITVVYRIA